MVMLTALSRIHRATHRATHRARHSRCLISGATLALVAAAVILPAALPTAPTAHASGSTLSYARGYSVQGSWLCYGWPSGAYHCTQHWHRTSSGTLVSTNAGWVPNVAHTGNTGNTGSGSGSGPTAAHPVASTPAPVARVTSESAVQFCTGSVDFSNAAQWATPHGCYGQIFSPNPANYPARPSWGWCNWIPEESHLQFAGYGALSQPKHYGAPRVGAVVWFDGGDQGASSDGHWATLVATGPNGWGLVEEMNFYYRGGGWGKADYRFIHLYQPGTAYLF